MACHCGAHWCWYCLRSTEDCIDECGTGDGAYDDYFNDFLEDDENESDNSDENDSDNSDEDMPEAAEAETQDDLRNADQEPSRAVQQDLVTNSVPSSPITRRNLDGGGQARWEHANADFGREP